MARVTILSILTCSLSMVLAAEDDKLLSTEITLNLSKLPQQEISYNDLPIQELLAKATHQDDKAKEALINKIYDEMLEKNFLKKISLGKLFRQPISADLSHKELVVYIVLSHAQQIPLPESIFSLQNQEASKGNPNAQFILGLLYANGYGIPSQNQKKNDKTAIKWFTRASGQRHALALIELGRMFKQGRGVPTQDQKENDRVALELFRKVADEGHVLAQIELGRMFKQGRGVPNHDQKENDRAALEWFRRAADQGHPIALDNVGWMHKVSRGVESQDQNENDIIAVEYYRKGANQGDPKNQVNLGWMYHKGRGVPSKDQKENDRVALEWFRKAADQGYAHAQFNMGLMYEAGRVVPIQDQKENDKIAVDWYRKAAEQDNPFAQLNLGSMYQKGRGVPSQNKKENSLIALKWFARAAKNGNINGKMHLKSFCATFSSRCNPVELSPFFNGNFKQLSEELKELSGFYTYLVTASRVTSFTKNIFSENDSIYQDADKAEKLLTIYQELLDHVQNPLFMLHYKTQLSYDSLHADLNAFLPKDATPYFSLDGPSIAILHNNELETTLKSILKTSTQMLKFIDKVEMKKSKRVLQALIKFENHLGSHTKTLCTQIKIYLAEEKEKSQGLRDYLAYAKDGLQEKMQQIEEHIACVGDLNERLITLIKETAPYRDYLFATKVLN